MKKNVNISFLTLLLGSCLVFTSCSSRTENDAEAGSNDVSVTKVETQVETESTNSTTTLSTDNKEYRAKFICPGHCPKSGSDKNGECRVCGMELIENPNF